MVARIKTWTDEVLTSTDLNAEFDNVINTLNTAASTSTASMIEVATAAEINTGTDAGRAVSPDTFAGSNFGIRFMGISCFAPATSCATGDGKGFASIPTAMNGMNLVFASSGVYTVPAGANTMDIQIRRVRLGVSADMLSTKITHGVGEQVAKDGVIDASNDDVETDDLVVVDVDAVNSTPGAGLVVILGFQLP